MISICLYVGEWISGATCNYIANYLVENAERVERVDNITLEIS